MDVASAPEDPRFDDGPLTEPQRWIGLIDGRDLKVVRRAVLVALVGWAPLFVFAAIQTVLLHAAGITALLWEVGVHARYLVAGPLLIIAELVCAARLNDIMRNFVDAGLVRDEERPRFVAAIASTRRWLNSTAMGVGVVAVAYIVVAATIWATPMDQVPPWHRTGGVAPAYAAAGYSLAGWWHTLVSLPLLLSLLLTWVVRFALWVRLLWSISRLDLRLVASHPDQAAGLAFVGHSLRCFAVVALALATIAAGKSAHIVLLSGMFPTSHMTFNVGMFISIGAMFAAPLLIFTPVLNATWRRAAFDYGALAERMGVAFEDKWLGRDKRVDHTALEQPDFSATTDLYQVVGNIYAMRLVPIDFTSVLIFAAAMMLPFVPVMFLVVPVKDILSVVKGMFL